MAGDWLPMRLDLALDPAVIAIATRTGLDDDTVVGKLHRLWSWANSQSRDGRAPGVTQKWLNAFLRATDFAEALCEVGWLEVEFDTETGRELGITIPRFDVWNSQTAKARILNSRRQSEYRSRNCSANRNGDRNANGATKARPKERREEGGNTPFNPPRNGATAGKGNGGKAAGKGKRCRPGDLLDDSRLDAYFREAAAKGRVSNDDAGKLLVFSAAEHAHRVAEGNDAAGLFIAIVFQQKHRSKITQEDEDAGNARVKSFYHGETARAESA